jgi:hypothetical protein
VYRTALLPLLLTACQSITAVDVERRFAQDFAGVRLRIPTKEDLDPARNAGGDMWATVALARDYLAADPGASMQARYVRALLACALLMRGQSDDARAVMLDVRPRRELALTRENQVINATVHTVSACRAVQARNALESLLRRELAVDEFVRSFGSFVGVQLPDPATPDYENMLRAAAARIRGSCFVEVPGDPREMEETHDQRTELHRAIGEQLYNDMAALLNALPDRHDAVGEWLHLVAVNSFLTFSRLYHEVVPMSLSPAQKQWQLEQTDGMFQRSQAAAARLEGRALYRELPRHLRNAQLEIRGWIETR